MSFEGFINQCWSDHGDAPEQVADRLSQNISLVTKPADVGPMVHIVTHIFGEHLAQWDRLAWAQQLAGDHLAMRQSLAQLEQCFSSFSEQERGWTIGNLDVIKAALLEG